jgi:hypothetical protein
VAGKKRNDGHQISVFGHSKQQRKLCIRDITEIHECACTQIHEQEYWITDCKAGEEIRLPELLEHFTSSFILKVQGCSATGRVIWL